MLDGLIGGVMSLIGGERRNSAAENLAKEQMEFQSFMSNSAHEREVQDLKRAGLNPMLTGKYGGSSTPPGASAQVEDTVTPAVNTALSAQRTRAEIELLREQAVKATAEADEATSQAGKNRASIPLIMEEIGATHAGARLSSAQQSELASREMMQMAEQIYKSALTDRVSIENALTRAVTNKTITEDDKAKLETFFRTMDWPRVHSESQAWSSWYGRNLMPFSKSVNELGNAAWPFARMFNPGGRGRVVEHRHRRVP